MPRSESRGARAGSATSRFPVDGIPAEIETLAETMRCESGWNDALPQQAPDMYMDVDSLLTRLEPGPEWLERKRAAESPAGRAEWPADEAGVRIG